MRQEAFCRGKPIYMSREETVLAEDEIIPYGDRIEASSESKRQAMVLKLLDIPEGESESEKISSNS